MPLFPFWVRICGNPGKGSKIFSPISELRQNKRVNQKGFNKRVTLQKEFLSFTLIGSGLLKAKP